MLHVEKSFQGSVDFPRADKLLADIAIGQVHPVQPISGPLVLYGKGSLGKLAKEYCKAVGQPVIAHIQQHEAWPTSITGHRVAVCVVTSPYVPIEHTLIGDGGFKYVFPFYDIAEKYRDVHPLSNGWSLGTINPHTATVLSEWHDDVSRAHHLQFLAWRRLREEWTFVDAPVTVSDRYFIPEVLDVLTENETFLDVGAHHGDVSNKFAELTDWKFKQIILIEPDRYNRVALSSKFHIWGSMYLDSVISEFVTISRKKFHEGLGYASQLSDTGQRPVTTETIDFHNLKPSFIKIHIEGHELAALKGAWNTLQTHRPIVALTVYHNADGVWKTPLWLMENLKNYRFLFRLHGWCGTGAVVYGIPEERYK